MTIIGGGGGGGSSTWTNGGVGGGGGSGSCRTYDPDTILTYVASYTSLQSISSCSPANPDLCGPMGTILVGKQDYVEIVERGGERRKECAYCGGYTKDDSRGNCCACGAPRKRI